MPPGGPAQTPAYQWFWVVISTGAGTPTMGTLALLLTTPSDADTES